MRGVAWSGAAPIRNRSMSGVGEGRRRCPRHSSANPVDTVGSGGSCSPGIESTGPATVRARATDQAGRAQPEQPEWNRLGYGGNVIQTDFSRGRVSLRASLPCVAIGGGGSASCRVEPRFCLGIGCRTAVVRQLEQRRCPHRAGVSSRPREVKPPPIAAASHFNRGMAALPKPMTAQSIRRQGAPDARVPIAARRGRL